MSLNTEPLWFQQMMSHNAVDPDPMVFRKSLQDNTICMYSGTTEMLRIAQDGFWVRGEKVAQDDREAEAVYNAFKIWLTWSQLNRDY